MMGFVNVRGTYYPAQQREDGTVVWWKSRKSWAEPILATKKIAKTFTEKF